MDINMEQITYNNIINELLKKFPEYEKSKRYYDDASKDLPYIVLGNLCLMIFEEIDQKQNIELAERLMQLTDKIFNDPNSDDKLINLFAIEVLENVTGSKTGAILAKKLFHGKSVDLLEQTLKHYNTDSFLNEYRKREK
jgi:hypothetical protein